MTKHTEGQWELRGEFMTRYIYAKGENISGIVATINLAWPAKAQQKEQLANAQLLFAAPDLLAALVALSTNPHISLDDLIYRVRDVEGQGWDGPAVKAWSDAVTAAKAAIAKATEVAP